VKGSAKLVAAVKYPEQGGYTLDKARTPARCPSVNELLQSLVNGAAERINRWA
jgi:hypothetical protein